ncbi:hypothetical protein BaRGS_00029643, partial [Batillaria attramentaria]
QTGHGNQGERLIFSCEWPPFVKPCQMPRSDVSPSLLKAGEEDYESGDSLASSTGLVAAQCLMSAGMAWYTRQFHCQNRGLSVPFLGLADVSSVQKEGKPTEIISSIPTFSLSLCRKDVDRMKSLLQSEAADVVTSVTWL